MRHHELSFLGFHSTRPMTAVVGGRLGETPLPPRGKSIAPNRGLPPSERQYNSKSPCIRQGRDFEILDETGRLAAPKNYFTTSQWPVLELPIRFIKDLRVNALI